MAFSSKDARSLYAIEMRDKINMAFSKRKPGLSFYDNQPTDRYVRSFDTYFRSRDTQGRTDDEFLREFNTYYRGEEPGC